MKRYFDIPEDKLTLQLEVTAEGMEYTVDQIEKAIGVSGLKEINKAEYNRLSEVYCDGK